MVRTTFTVLHWKEKMSYMLLTLLNIGIKE